MPYLMMEDSLKAADVLKRIKELGKTNGVEVIYDKTHGKGSHGTVYYGDRRTTIKGLKKEIGVGLLHSMLDDLSISKEQFYDGD